MLKLPVVPKSVLNAQPIHWGSLPKRYLHPGELEILVALARSVGARNMLEIGVNTGRTAKALLDNVQTLEHYQGVDVPAGYAFDCSVQKNEVPAKPGHYALDDPRFELLIRPRGSFDLGADELRPCDMVFVDGDHSTAAVTHDAHLATGLLRPGGLIVFHDYHDLGTVGVRDVMHELADRGWDLRHVEDTWLVVARGRAEARLAA